MQAVLLPREPRTTLTVARIGGGESINSVPREAWLEVDIRSLGAAALTDLARTLRETVARIERSENGRRTPDTAPLVSRIEQLGDRPCGTVSPDAPLVRLAMDVTRTMGATPRLAAGSTDASVPIALGIPAIAIGAGGRGGGTHTPAEWYDDTHGVRGLERALRIVIGAAELHR
jgi:acetylornithine deacetylase/succinyl-diaminopimelate desuccinylase-like protein